MEREEMECWEHQDGKSIVCSSDSVMMFIELKQFIHVVLVMNVVIFMMRMRHWSWEACESIVLEFVFIYDVLLNHMSDILQMIGMNLS